MEQIVCRDLKLGYEKKVVADGVTFTVSKGDYLCIVGENGTGKSTLMKVMLGLLKPMGGSIEYVGASARHIGYLPQQTDVQKDFPAAVKEIVLSGCLNKSGLRPFYTKGQKALAAKNMEKMGIGDLANRSYKELSGGQQQRVLLARALCATEDILFLDEPVAGLDPKVTEEMYAVIESLNKEGMTIIMISHDLAAAMRYSSHILNMGHDFFFGPTADFAARREGGEQNG